jgi:hypothetical protein
MHQFRTILILGVLAFAGCSANRNAVIFHPWGWEDAADAKSRLDGYKHVLVARVDECSWEDRDPHRLTPYHFKATVIRSYKGDWGVSERISFVHYVDASAPATSTTNAPGGYPVFIFSNDHTNGEIALDTGEWGRFNEELAPALEIIYPERGTIHSRRRSASIGYGH